MSRRKFTLQETLSLGYLLLILLGLISDVIYYKILGVDILGYVDLLDVLLSPVSIVTEDLATAIAFTAVIGGCYFFVAVIGMRLHRRFRDRRWYQRLNNMEKADKLYDENDPSERRMLVVFMVVSMFLGFGSARGVFTKQDLRDQPFSATHILSFSSGEELPVHLVGQNSAYLFYLPEGQQVVSIAPIAQNVREIRKVVKEEESQSSLEFAPDPAEEEVSQERPTG